MALDAKRLMQLERCEAALGIFFSDKSLLNTALTHSSYANERPRSGLSSNERLEFFGDSVLSFVVSEYLYRNFASDEGSLSKMRAAIVCENSLYAVARHFELEKYMLVGGALRGAPLPKAIVADCVEAVIGALCLDGAYDGAREFVMRCLDYLLTVARVLSDGVENPKSQLQELCQRKSKKLPEYKLDNAVMLDGNVMSFSVSVLFDGKVLATGCGCSQKEAERDAARNALKVGL